MKIMLPYVKVVRRGRRTYYYFRSGVDGHGYGGKNIKLPDLRSREFQDRYDALLRAHAPHVAMAPKRAGRGGEGSLAWVIAQFKEKSKQWEKASTSTRDVYQRRFQWLVENYGAEPIAAFDRDAVKRIRDLKEFANKPSVADAIIERFATLWDFAEEFCHLSDMKAHNGINPARNIKKLKEGEAESAPLWPLALCKAFEAYPHPDLVTFYFLARYTGQRRSDLTGMEWEHINPVLGETGAMFVAQIKTGARIWVPMPKRLRDYLATWPKRGKYIVPSPKRPTEPWAHTSVTNEMIRVTRDLGFTTTDSRGEPRNYSPHGLRHLCGVELAHAGADDRQIAAVLGHATLKQVQTYVKQANQFLLAQHGQRKRDEMYEREHLETMIAAADNVARLRPAM
jgi:integrase